MDALAPHFTVEDMITEGDRVGVRWTNAGTHIGEVAGLPATGRTFTTAGIDIYRVEGDMLAEHWHVVDQLAMLGQLGLLPAPGDQQTTRRSAASLSGRAASYPRQ